MVEVSTVKPLTPKTFRDLEALFAQGGCSFARDCWCMGYRIRGRPKPPDGVAARDHRRQLLLALSKAKPSPGLIGYDREGRPVGWVTFGPRAGFARLTHSPVMKAVDDTPVWSIVCFVVPKANRGQGVAAAMLEHALAAMAKAGARVAEAYPIDKYGRSQDQWLWHGTASMFAKAGFVEVARRKPTRPVMRKTLA